jgi:hypothetical protein
VAGWRPLRDEAGVAGLYRSMLTEGEELCALGKDRPLQMPATTIGSRSGAFTYAAFREVTGGVPGAPGKRPTTKLQCPYDVRIGARTHETDCTRARGGMIVSAWVGVLASLAILAGASVVAQGSPLALARARMTTAACAVSVVRSPLTLTEARLVFSPWGKPPVMAPDGDIYFAPTMTYPAIQELGPKGRLVWRYGLSPYALLGWAATPTDLLALTTESATTSFMTVNLRTHAVATTTVPNLSSYQVVTGAHDIVFMGLPDVLGHTAANGLVLVLTASGHVVKRSIPAAWVSGGLSAATYGPSVYLLATAGAVASPSGHGDTVYALDQIERSSIRSYRVTLPFGHASFEVVAANKLLFFGSTPGTVDAIVSVQLGAPVRVLWRTSGPVGTSLGLSLPVSYGTTVYMPSDVKDSTLSAPAWRLDVANGRSLGQLMMPGYDVHPVLAGPWGLIALEQKGLYARPGFAVFAPNGALRFTVTPNATSVEQTETLGFVMASAKSATAGAVFLSSALPKGVALALPATCKPG